MINFQAGIVDAKYLFHNENNINEYSKKKNIMKRDAYDPFCSETVASTRAIRYFILSPSPSRRTGFTRGRFRYKGRTRRPRIVKKKDVSMILTEDPSLLVVRAIHRSPTHRPIKTRRTLFVTS